MHRYDCLCHIHAHCRVNCHSSVSTKRSVHVQAKYGPIEAACGGQVGMACSDQHLGMAKQDRRRALLGHGRGHDGHSRDTRSCRGCSR